MSTYSRYKNEDKYKGTVPISALFEKYKKRLRPPQGIVISAFCAVVGAELGVILSEREVRYGVHTRTLSITTFGPQKTEILLNKTRILASCREILGELGAPQQIV